MTRRTISTAAIGILTALAVGVFAVTLMRAIYYAPNGDTSEAASIMASTISATSTRLLPSWLMIPSLGVDASVQSVGITAAGNMAAPHGFTDVGWYKYGTVPGDIGSAVIAGHVDNGLGLDGVFKHLSDIKQGADIYVVDTAGNKLHFVVDRIATYPYQAVPTDILFGQKDAARLNLITCEGDWVGKDKTYDHRFVVYATLRG